jgi:hypothetical protein
MSNIVTVDFGENYVETPCTSEAEVKFKGEAYRGLISGQCLITCLEVLKNWIDSGTKQADWIIQAPTLVKVMLGLHYEHYKSALLDQIKSELDYRVLEGTVDSSTAQVFMTACEEANQQHVEILATASSNGGVDFVSEPTQPAVLVEGTHEFKAGDDSGSSELKLPPIHAVKEVSPCQVALDEA